jgi:hypothetical protein
MEGFGEAKPPRNPLLWARYGGKPPHLAHKKDLARSATPQTSGLAGDCVSLESKYM